MISFIPPGIVLGLLLCALYAGLFHIWGGRSLRGLLVYLIAAILGFALGQLIGMLIKLPLPHIGQIFIFEASILAWIAMIGARELRYGQSRVDTS